MGGKIHAILLSPEKRTVVTPFNVVAAVVCIHVATGTQVEHFANFSAVDSQDLEDYRMPRLLCNRDTLDHY